MPPVEFLSVYRGENSTQVVTFARIAGHRGIGVVVGDTSEALGRIESLKEACLMQERRI